MDAGTAPVVIHVQLVLSTEASSCHLPKQRIIPLQAGPLVTDLISRLQTAYKDQVGEISLAYLTEKSVSLFPLYDLTCRQRDVIELLRKRRSHKQIAAELHIASRTVDKHVENIYEKMGVNSKSEVF